MSRPSLRKVLDYYQIEVPDSGRMEQSILCPAHEEHRPSCSFNEELGLLNCKSCGFAGDVYSLIMKREGLEFYAAKSLAESITGESSRDVSRPARTRREGHGVPGRQGAFKPKYRNTPARSRPLSTGG